MINNKSQASIIILLCLVLITIFVSAITLSGGEYSRLLKFNTSKNKVNDTNSTNETIEAGIPLTKVTLASWNLDVFGRTKAQSDALMNYYADKINDYDMIIIQEIQDKTGEAFKELCDLLPDYKCELSSRAGRTQSKEQYGIIYKKWIHMKQFTDYNPDPKNRWEYPPLKFIFEFGQYNIIVYTIHINPSDATYELQMLEYLVKDEGNAVIIGDLSADCSYYSRYRDPTFKNWEWLITDNDDTTVSETNCAYDRILINNLANNYVWSHGIMTDVNIEQSDHYLIWVTFEG